MVFFGLMASLLLRKAYEADFARTHVERMHPARVSVGRTPVPGPGWLAIGNTAPTAPARGEMRAMRWAAVQHEPEIRNRDAESKKVATLRSLHRLRPVRGGPARARPRPLCSGVLSRQ